MLSRTKPAEAYTAKVSRSTKEPLSQAMEDDQDGYFRILISENIFLPKDRERKQEDDSENSTSLGTHTYTSPR